MTEITWHGGQTFTANLPVTTSPAGFGPVTFEDDFARLDPTCWNVRNGYSDAQDTSVMLPRNASIVDGQLAMQAVKDTGSSARPWSSAYLDTIGKFSQRYGRWEIRLRALEPGKSRGMWPAFWLRDDQGGGEIDVYETIGTPAANPQWGYTADGSAVSSTFYKVTGKGTKGVDRTNTVIGHIKPPIFDFHTYACEWTPAGIATFYDGVKALEVKAGTALGDQILSGFTSKANIRLDMFVGTSWAGFPDSNTTSPNVLTVDYVRVWALQS